MSIQVTYDGSDVTTSLLSYSRQQKICSGIGNASFVFKMTFAPTPQTYKEFVIYEDGIKKGTYIVSDYTYDVPNSTLIFGTQDYSKRLQDYFVDTQTTITTATYARTLLEQYLTEAGVSYNINTVDNGNYVNDQSVFGFADALSIIIPLLQMNGWYMYFDANAVAQIGHFQFDTIAFDHSIGDSSMLNYKVQEDDAMYRNRVVVWGMTNINGDWVHADVTQQGGANEYDANDIRTIVVANSFIDTNASALAIANLAIAEFTKQTRIASFDVAGFTNYVLGDRVKINSSYGDFLGTVTSIGSSVDSSGFKTHVMLDERCPRLFSYYNVNVGHLSTVNMIQQITTQYGFVFKKQFGEYYTADVYTGSNYTKYSTGGYNIQKLLYGDYIFLCGAASITRHNYKTGETKVLAYAADLGVSGTEMVISDDHTAWSVRLPGSGLGDMVKYDFDAMTATFSWNGTAFGDSTMRFLYIDPGSQTIFSASDFGTAIQWYIWHIDTMTRTRTVGPSNAFKTPIGTDFYIDNYFYFYYDGTNSILTCLVIGLDGTLLDTINLTDNGVNGIGNYTSVIRSPYFDSVIINVTKTDGTISLYKFSLVNHDFVKLFSETHSGTESIVLTGSYRDYLLIRDNTTGIFSVYWIDWQALMLIHLDDIPSSDISTSPTIRSRVIINTDDTDGGILFVQSTGIKKVIPQIGSHTITTIINDSGLIIGSTPTEANPNILVGNKLILSAADLIIEPV